MFDVKMDVGDTTEIHGNVFAFRGVREVRGSFASGDPVEISTLDGKPFARGLSVYSADEVRLISGLRSAEIEARLGYRLLDCVVHRDDLVVT